MTDILLFNMINPSVSNEILSGGYFIFKKLIYLIGYLIGWTKI